MAQSFIIFWSLIVSSSRTKFNFLLPLLIACDVNGLPEKSLADNPEDLTDTQIEELINSAGMSQLEAEALEEEMYDLLDECLDGNEEACDDLSKIIEELEDDSEDDEDDDSEENEDEENEDEENDESEEGEGNNENAPELEF